MPSHWSSEWGFTVPKTVSRHAILNKIIFGLPILAHECWFESQSWVEKRIVGKRILWLVAELVAWLFCRSAKVSDVKKFDRNETNNTIVFI